MKKRDIFGELMGGFDALDKARDGQLTLNRRKVKRRPESQISREARRALRSKLKAS